jgi:multicomponent Na+:H+ antiporter subunit A
MEQQSTAVELALWHGFHPALALSLIGFLLGAGLFWKLTRFRTAAVRQDLLLNWGPARWYAWMMVLFLGVARVQTRILQNGYLNIYLLVITFVSVGLVGAPLLKSDISFEVSRWWSAPVYELLLACIILFAAILIVKTNSRLTAVVSLGVVGYGVALLFLIFSAPDLAMTQFAIETLSIVLLVLILLRLPAHRNHSRPLQRLRDVIPALMGGAVMTALVLASTAVNRESRLVPYFVEHSLSMAHGLNLVNVILVDFRGLDTLGEIVVLSIAALGVYAMLRLRIKPVDHNQE